MPFCPKCGTEYQADTKFCGKCGENLESVAAPVAEDVEVSEPVAEAAAPAAEAAAPAAEAAAPAAEAAAPAAKQGPGFFQKLMDTKDVTDTFDAADLTSKKSMAILAYCAIFAYILVAWILGSFAGLIVAGGMLVAPCISAKSSEYLRYVISQLLVGLFGVMLVGIIDGAVAGGVFSLLYSAIYLGTWNAFAATAVATLVAWLLHLIIMAVPIFILVVGFIDTIKGKAKRHILVGNFRTIFEK